MIAKPARKVWYEIGNRNGQVFVVSDPDKVYYQQAYYNDYGNVQYQDEGEIDTWLLPDVKFIPHWKFDMPPIQGVQEKPVCMQDHIATAFFDQWRALDLGVSKYEETGPPPPGKPNPLITPTTVHGNYPRKTIMDKYTKEFFKHSAIPGRYRERRHWLMRFLVRFIDWLNKIVGADKPKRKDKNDKHPSWVDVYTEHQNEEPSMWFRPVLRLIDWIDGNAAPTKAKNSSEQMETLADLFDPIIDKRNRPIDLYTQIGDTPPQQAMAQKMIEDAIEDVDREHGTPHTTRG